MNQNPNSCGPHESSGNPMSSSRYDEPPPSYSECIQLPTWTPQAVNPSSSIPTAPVFPQDLHPPSSAPPSNTTYVSVPYPVQQPTPINGRSSNDVVTRPPTWTPVPVPRTNDYMAQSIVSLFLCCPLGFVALLYSCQTRSSVEEGDLERAAKTSRTALILNRISRFGVIFILLIPVLIFFVVTNNMKSKDPWHPWP